MRSNRTATLRLLAVSLVFCGIAGFLCGLTGFSNLRAVSHSTIPNFSDHTVLRLASYGLYPANSPMPLDATKFAKQIRNRLFLLVAVSIFLIAFGGYCAWEMQRRETGDE